MINMLIRWTIPILPIASSPGVSRAGRTYLCGRNHKRVKPTLEAYSMRYILPFKDAFSRSTTRSKSGTETPLFLIFKISPCDFSLSRFTLTSTGYSPCAFRNAQRRTARSNRRFSSGGVRIICTRQTIAVSVRAKAIAVMIKCSDIKVLNMESIVSSFPEGGNICCPLLRCHLSLLSVTIFAVCAVPFIPISLLLLLEYKFIVQLGICT